MVIFGFSKILFLFYISKFFQKFTTITSDDFRSWRFEIFFIYGVLRTITLEKFLSLPQKSSRRWFYSLHHNSKGNSDEMEPMWGRNLSKTYYNTANMLSIVSHLIHRLKIRSHEFNQNCLYRKRCVQMRRFRNLNWTKFKNFRSVLR